MKWPFLVAAAALLFANVFAAAVQLSSSVPLSPWEPAIAIEALRLNAGLPIYSAAHATHLYGPLLNLLFAGVFRIAGFNLIAARVAMSIFALAVSVALALAVSKDRSAVAIFFGAMLFLGLNLRTNLIAVSLQPDWAATCFAVLALLVWVRREKSVIRSVLALALFVVSMLFKQTAAAFALVPVAHCLLWKSSMRRRSCISAMLPLLSVAFVLAGVRWICPQMYHAIVAVPASIHRSATRLPLTTLYLFATYPVFFAALWSVRRWRCVDECERWILSALFIFVPVSICVMSKAGSDYNSLLFAYLAMSALVVRRVYSFSEWFTLRSTLRTFVASAALGIILLFSYLVQTPRDLALLTLRHGDDHYEACVSVARSIDGKVVSPQDPTIAWRANQYFGRSFYCELDTNAVNGNWPNELPMSILREIQDASAVITVKSYVPAPQLEAALHQLHWHQRDVPELADSVYSVWTRP